MCFLASVAAFALTALVVAALWLGWVFSQPGSSRQLGMLLPEALALLTGTHATAENALLSWDPAQKRLSLRWNDAVFASPRQPGVLAVRHLAAEIRYGWQNEHFLTIDFLKLDQPQLFLPKAQPKTRSDPFLIPTLKTLEHLHWPFAFLKQLEVTDGYAELGRQNALAKIKVSFTATKGRPALLFLSGNWLKGETVIPFRLRAEQLPNRQFDLRVIADSARILSPQFADGEVFLADARAHIVLKPERRRLSLSALHIETADVPLRARANLTWDDDIIGVIFAAATGEMTQMQLLRLWPLMVGQHPREWIQQHLSEGRVTAAEVRGRLRIPLVDPSRTHVDALDGTIDMRGFTVNYLAGMPPVTALNGSAAFDAQDFRIKVQSGVSQNVQIKNGDLRFATHPEGHSILDLKLQLEGALADQLTIVRSIPAAQKGDWGFAPEDASGQGVTDLAMLIPLELKHEHLMTLDATATLTGAGLPLAKGRFRLANADAVVKASLSEVTAKATGTLNSVPVKLEWWQPLTGTGTWRADFSAEGDAALWDALADVPISRYASGPVAAVGRVNGAGDLRLAVPLTETHLKMDAINWQKPAGSAARLNLMVEGATDLYHFDYTGETERLTGDLTRDAAGGIAAMTITDGSMGRSQLNGRLTRNADGRYLGTFTAAGLDLSGLFDDDKTPAAKRGKRSWGWTSLPPMEIEARVQNLWLDQEADQARNAELSLLAGAQGLQRIALRAELGQGHGFSANIFPDDSTPQQDLRLLVTAQDAGLFLRTLGLYRNIRGGELELAARLPRTGATTADGSIRISAFSLMRAPVLARLLSVASLTGPLNLLTGQGIAFDGLYAEWTLSEDDVLTLRKGLMAGMSLGLQAEGKIDLHHETLDLNGAIVPVYVLSSVIGYIPILGDLLTNNQQEGLIAMRYKMRGLMSDPSITVNPFTALTPGFLRGFFDIFKEAPKPVPAPESLAAPQPKAD